MNDMNDVSAQIGNNVEEWTFDGTQGEIAARSWLSATDDPRYVAVLVHGYGEHIGRYDHVAAALIADGAVVYGLDHLGHGKSDGERVLVSNFDDVVTDVDRLVEQAQDVWPDLPLVMIGHSMGGMIAARYAQVHGEKLTALVLSAAVIGAFELIPQLLALDEMPDDPLPPEVLSRDPAVCEAYAADPLVWHGPFKRPTVEAMAAMIGAIDAADVGARRGGSTRPHRRHARGYREAARRFVPAAHVPRCPTRGVQRDELGRGARRRDGLRRRRARRRRHLKAASSSTSFHRCASNCSSCVRGLVDGSPAPWRRNELHAPCRPHRSAWFEPGQPFTRLESVRRATHRLDPQSEPPAAGCQGVTGVDVAPSTDDGPTIRADSEHA